MSDGPSIQVTETREGCLTYLVALGAEQLPPVGARALQNAWDAAREEAEAARWGAVRVFRFVGPGRDTAPVDLLLADPDACAWAGAIDRRHALSTPTGLSLCLRLLGLVGLLAEHGWAGALCRFRPDGAELDPVLLEAAGRLPLTREGRLDETVLREQVGARLRRRIGARP